MVLVIHRSRRRPPAAGVTGVRPEGQEVRGGRAGRDGPGGARHWPGGRETPVHGLRRPRAGSWRRAVPPKKHVVRALRRHLVRWAPMLSAIAKQLARAAELVFRTAVGAAQFIFRARGVRGAQRVSRGLSHGHGHSACLICHRDLLRNARYRHSPPLSDSFPRLRGWLNRGLAPRSRGASLLAYVAGVGTAHGRHLKARLAGSSPGLALTDPSLRIARWPAAEISGNPIASRRTLRPLGESGPTLPSANPLER
jgi:hypothetical protein